MSLESRNTALPYWIQSDSRVTSLPRAQATLRAFNNASRKLLLIQGNATDQTLSPTQPAHFPPSHPFTKGTFNYPRRFPCTLGRKLPDFVLLDCPDLRGTELCRDKTCSWALHGLSIIPVFIIAPFLSTWWGNRNYDFYDDNYLRAV